MNIIVVILNSFEFDLILQEGIFSDMVYTGFVSGLVPERASMHYFPFKNLDS